MTAPSPPAIRVARVYGDDERECDHRFLVDRFPEFARRYHAELRRPPASEAVDRLLATARTRAVTLLTATRDVEHSGARVLLDHLTRDS